MLINKNIAVLITCHNRKEKTISCLASLYQCTIPENYLLEVFLVDDGSTDGTAQLVSGLFPKVTIIQGDGNLYWNRGMHLAWETAAQKKQYDYYLWLNDDSFVFPFAIEELLKINQKSNSSVLVCGALCSKSNQFTYGLLKNKSEPVLINKQNNTGELMNGNCVLIPRAVYEKVGNLDITFPHAIGDYDYGLRSIKKGFKLLTTEVFIANCDRNEKLPQWCYSETPLVERFKKLYSPLGNAHPNYFFIYEKRHFGLSTAIKHFITIHLRVLIPQLWK